VKPENIDQKVFTGKAPVEQLRGQKVKTWLGSGIDPTACFKKKVLNSVKIKGASVLGCSESFENKTFKTC
jgi:hypothetical protein